jgi:hypothetical protein
MLKAVQLPARCANLDACLAHMKWNTFTLRATNTNKSNE